jgi:hypothetical protein
MGRAPVGVERQRGELLGRRGGHLLAVAVADLGAEQARQRVDVAVALRVEDVRPLAALEHEQVVDLGLGEMQEQVLPCRLLELVVGHGPSLRDRDAQGKRRGGADGSRCFVHIVLRVEEPRRPAPWRA